MIGLDNLRLLVEAVDAKLDAAVAVEGDNREEVKKWAKLKEFLIYGTPI